MTQLPQPPKGFDPEWAAQNNRVIEGRLRGLSTLEQRFSTLSDTVAGDLTAIATLTGTGFLARTADDSWALRTLTGPAAGITVTNGAGIAGNPTLTLANDLAALEGLGSTGIAVRTGADAWAQRTITGTANEMTVTNGNGVSGNPTLSLPAALTFTGKTVTGGTFNSGAFNGTVGATTPSTGAFTTATASGGMFVNIGQAFTTFSANYGLGTPNSDGLQIFAGTSDRIRFGGMASGTFTQWGQWNAASLAVSGAFSCIGSATLGDATSDTCTVNGLLDTRPAGGGIMFRVQETTSGSARRIQFSNSGTVNRIESTTGSGATSLTLAVDNVVVATLAPSSFAVAAALSCTGNATLGDAGTDTVGASGRIFSNDAHNNAGGLAGTVQQWYGSATYTPAGTGVANVSSIVPAKAQYLRVARVVTVSGTVDISPTAATTTTTFRLSLGVTSSLAALSDLAGSATFIAGSVHGPVVVYADTTNDEAFFSFTSANILTHSITYQFTYEVL